MRFAVVCAHFRREIALVSTENRAILRPIWCDFGAQHARIGRKMCAIIVGSRCTCCRAALLQIFERAVRSARKIHKFLHENRTCSRRFLRSFCTQHARCECATLAEVLSDVLKMICGISAVFECDLRLSACNLGAKLRRFRLEIARFCVRFGAILARKTRAFAMECVKSSSAVVARR